MSILKEIAVAVAGVYALLFVCDACKRHAAGGTRQRCLRAVRSQRTKAGQALFVPDDDHSRAGTALFERLRRRCLTGKTLPMANNLSILFFRTKIFHFAEIRNCRMRRSLRPNEEGRIAIVTTPGPDGDGRRLHRRESGRRAGNRERSIGLMAARS
jgi:hypothetical protein